MVWHTKEVNSREKKWQRKTKNKSTRRRRTWRKDYTLDSVCPLCVFIVWHWNRRECVLSQAFLCVSWIFSILKQPRRQSGRILCIYAKHRIQLSSSLVHNSNIHFQYTTWFNSIQLVFFTLFSLCCFPVCHRHHHRHRSCRRYSKKKKK